MNEKNEAIIDEKLLKDKIYIIRGVQVMIDSDLAEIYGYTTKAFNQQVKNNIEKFDEEDLMFQLTKEEAETILRSKILTLEQEEYNLRSKFSTSSLENTPNSSRTKFSTLNEDKLNLRSNNSTLEQENLNLRSKILTSSWGGTRYTPYAFTEQGVYMLMTVLKGELATKQSKALVRLFKQMKDYIVDNQQMINQRDFLRLSLQTAENAQNIVEFRQKLTEIDDKVENVVSNLGDMVRKSELSPIMLNLGKPEIPPGWLILNGQPVESDLAYQQIYTLANKSISIIDNYISLKTLVLFRHAKQNVSVTIYTDNTNNGLHKVEFDDFCKEYSGLKIDIKKADNIFHDRYIILDYNTSDEKIYHCGSSSKDGGRKVTTITKIDDTSIYKPLLAQLQKKQTLVLK
ncbi:ORF6N domain-containing protein [Treponema bryantii]|uniref:ORF6N domain-containing protein n=1 Tax=Treponema bryantii TaxID=163 RepID=UPI0003B5F088|nr:ORF6N domain-containing protein [Treponema bryantii]